MSDAPGRADVGEVELPELRVRNGFLLLTMLDQPVKHDGAEVDIWIHNLVRALFAVVCELEALGSNLA
jgi:hypothetical protein